MTQNNRYIDVLASDFHADIKQAVKTLRSGGILLYPTDTVWGLGCDATNQQAVSRIFALKQREESKSMLVLMANTSMVERYVNNPQDIALQLLEESATPLTLILDDVEGLAPGLIADDGSVGIRIPNEKFCQEVLKAFRKPVVSTSANISGCPAPSIFTEIPDEIKSGADYIVNYRQDDNTKSKPSSIIKISKGGLFKIIRQ